MDTHISPENMITFLVTTPVFEDLAPHEIGELIPIIEVKSFRDGDILFHEGDAGDAWYVLYSGELEVSKILSFCSPKVIDRSTSRSEKTIRTLDPGSCFGEIAILDGLPRSATIRATKDSVVLRVPQDKLNELIDKNDLIAYKLIRRMALMLASGQRSNTETLSKLLLANELSHVHESIKQIVGDSSVKE